MSSKDKTVYQKYHSFISDSPTAIYQGLLGTALTYKNLVVLENHKIMLRRDHRTMIGKVKILAGGGAGLEPADVGYIGQGMLTGVVLGDISVAPSASSILTAIRELAYEHTDGILLLVKNYIGDYLNFGLALERAINENITIKMLVIKDDSSNPNPGKFGRRGLAGSVLVYKIAGALAEAGKSLDDIFHLCQEKIVTDLSTVSICTSPSPHFKWMYFDDTINNAAIFGMGLYGQPGFEKNWTGLSEIICEMLDVLFSKSSNTNDPDDKAPIVVLINNIGATHGLDENFITFHTVHELLNRNFNVLRLYSGKFMSLLDSKGFSITILKVTDAGTLEHLDAATSAFSWPMSSFSKTDLVCNTNLSIPPAFSATNSVTRLPLIVKPELNHKELDQQKYQNMTFQTLFSDNDRHILKQIIYFAAEALISCEKQINTIDLEVGDGDAGTMLRKGATSIKESLEEGRINLFNPFRLLQDLAQIMERSIGGATGALYSIFFNAASTAFLNVDTISCKSWCEAFKSGVKALECYGKVEIGERTLLDALHPTMVVFELAVSKNEDIHRMVSNIACTCEFHASETRGMKPIYARGNYSKNKLMHPDAGAHAVAVWIRAVCEAIKLSFPE